VKPLEADARRRRQQQSGVLAQLRLFKGQRLDPNNPAHLSLLQRAAELGVEVDVDSFNNAAGNMVAVELVDPDNPTQKRRQFYNRVTGELSEAVGQSSYLQPVDPQTGMTPAQAATDEDRDAARRQSASQFRAREGRIASTPRAGGGQKSGQNRRETSLLDRFTREKELAFRAPSAGARKRHAANAQAIGATLRDNYNYEYGQDEQGNPYVKPPVSSAPAPPQQQGTNATPSRQYTADEVRARARSAGKDPEAAVSAARARGLMRE